MEKRYMVAAVFAVSLILSGASFSSAAGRGGGNCSGCPMSGITAEQKADIRQQLKELKESGATGEEIKAFKAGILEEYGVRMPEGRQNRGRNRKKAR